MCGARKRTRTSLSGALIFTVAFAVLPMSTASADSFGTGPPEAGWLANGRLHTYCHGAGTSGPTREDIVNYAMAWLANPTVMVRDFHSWCTLNTDVIWEFGEIDRARGVRGRYRCLSLSGNVCHQATLKIDPVVTGDMVNHRKTACHELGHSVGLRHSTQCMISGAAPDDSIQYRRYRSHHIWHINDHY